MSVRVFAIQPPVHDSAVASMTPHRTRRSAIPTPNAYSAASSGGPGSCIGGWSAVVLVGLLLDEVGTELRVDRPFQRRALVVAHVHRACERDELLVELPRALLDADVVLDAPQRLVHALEPGTLLRHGIDARQRGPDAVQQVEFATHVR